MVEEMKVRLRGRAVRRLGWALLLGLALAPSTGWAKKKPEPDIDYGAAPDWERYKEIAEREIRLRLVDPDSAQFTWHLGYYRGRWKPFLEPSVYGYVSCGYVNARNRMGGYAGTSNFAVVIRNDKIVWAGIGKPSGNDNLSKVCVYFATHGVFPPASAMTGATNPKPAAPATASAFGFTVNAVPDGAYVATVVPGSPAEKVGLKPGMVISHLNGVGLKGLDGAMLGQLIEAVTGQAELTVIGGAVLRITRNPTPPPTNIAGKAGA